MAPGPTVLGDPTQGGRRSLCFPERLPRAGCGGGRQETWHPPGPNPGRIPTHTPPYLQGTWHFLAFGFQAWDGCEGLMLREEMRIQAGRAEQNPVWEELWLLDPLLLSLLLGQNWAHTGAAGAPWPSRDGP